MKCEKLVLLGAFARSPLVMGSTIPPRGDKLSKPLTSPMKLMRINVKVGNIKQILSLTHPNCLTSQPRTMHDSGPINPLFLRNLYTAALVKGSLQMLHRMHQMPTWMGVSGEGPVPVQLGSVSTGIDPMRRGPASLEGPPSLLSQWSECPLQGLTCEKKTKSTLVKEADLYRNEKMT